MNISGNNVLFVNNYYRTCINQPGVGQINPASLYYDHNLMVAFQHNKIPSDLQAWMLSFCRSLWNQLFSEPYILIFAFPWIGSAVQSLWQDSKVEWIYDVSQLWWLLVSASRTKIDSLYSPIFIIFNNMVTIASTGIS